MKLLGNFWNKCEWIYGTLLWDKDIIDRKSVKQVYIAKITNKKKKIFRICHYVDEKEKEQGVGLYGNEKYIRTVAKEIAILTGVKLVDRSKDSETKTWISRKIINWRSLEFSLKEIFFHSVESVFLTKISSCNSELLLYLRFKNLENSHILPK